MQRIRSFGFLPSGSEGAERCERSCRAVAGGADAVFADECVRVFCAGGVGVGDVDRGAGARAGGVLDCPYGAVAAAGVVVEAEDDGGDAEAAELLEQLGGGAGAAERGGVVDAVGGELVVVEEAFDEDELARSPLEAVGRQLRPAGAAQVQVAVVGCDVLVDGSRPEGADASPFGAPGAAQPPRPAWVREDAGGVDLRLAEAAPESVCPVVAAGGTTPSEEFSIASAGRPRRSR
jgi:hypothetical protein